MVSKPRPHLFRLVRPRRAGYDSYFRIVLDYIGIRRYPQIFAFTMKFPKNVYSQRFTRMKNKIDCDMNSFDVIKITVPCWKLTAHIY